MAQPKPHIIQSKCCLVTERTLINARPLGQAMEKGAARSSEATGLEFGVTWTHCLTLWLMQFRKSLNSVTDILQ